MQAISGILVQKYLVTLVFNHIALNRKTCFLNQLFFRIRDGDSTVKISPIGDAQYLAYLKVAKKRYSNTLQP